MAYPVRVLFLCTGNSARSQIAEALLRSYGGSDFDVHSAGTDPRELHPMAIEVMRNAGIDISRQASKHLDQYLGEHFDYIITVCDRARDNCPTFPGDAERIHWSFDDPAIDMDDEAAQLRLFKRVSHEISERIRNWVAMQSKHLNRKGVSHKAW